MNAQSTESPIEILAIWGAEYRPQVLRALRLPAVAWLKAAAHGNEQLAAVAVQEHPGA